MKYLSKTKIEKLKGTALVRLDFNSEDAWRMEAAVPTIKLLLKAKAKVVVVSHKGHPSFAEAANPAQTQEVVKKFTLKKDALKLSKLLKKPVTFVADPSFVAIHKKIIAAKPGDVLVLENIRFFPGEEKNDSNFARELAAEADYYVNEAFAVSHRQAASVCAITEFLPSYCGLGLEKEIVNLSAVMKSPKKPFVVLIGGGKAADKLPVIENLSKKADAVLLGGVSANTLLKLRGDYVGNSPVDETPELVPVFNRILENTKVILPVDATWEDEKICDIGPVTADLYAQWVKKAGTVLWGGPMGLFEKKKFAKGTLTVAQGLAKNKSGFAVTGGGETVEFFRAYKLTKAFKFISTGGGAMLEFLAGKKLPGIEALK
jgi:phosphoglycerate kinase